MGSQKFGTLEVFGYSHLNSQQDDVAIVPQAILFKAHSMTTPRGKPFEPCQHKVVEASPIAMATPTKVATSRQHQEWW